jgi:hypothetical protein
MTKAEFIEKFENSCEGCKYLRYQEFEKVTSIGVCLKMLEYDIRDDTWHIPLDTGCTLYTKKTDELIDLFYEQDFEKRLRKSISEAWKIFQYKVGNDLIKINKEASMQLQYAYILQNLLPLIIYEKTEHVEIELEKTVKLNNGNTHETDAFLIGRKNNIVHNIAIEMKCYKEIASSGELRGATDIFMKDVYADLELLEKYYTDGICQDKVFFAMADLERLVNPKKKDGKCWDYDISNNYKLTPREITTPIGGKKQSIVIKENYRFDWTKNGNYYFLEL